MGHHLNTDPVVAILLREFRTPPTHSLRVVRRNFNEAIEAIKKGEPLAFGADGGVCRYMPPHNLQVDHRCPACDTVGSGYAIRTRLGPPTVPPPDSPVPRNRPPSPPRSLDLLYLLVMTMLVVTDLALLCLMGWLIWIW